MSVVHHLPLQAIMHLLWLLALVVCGGWAAPDNEVEKRWCAKRGWYCELVKLTNREFINNIRDLLHLIIQNG